MKQFDFSLVVSGLDPDGVDFEDCLFEAGCGDATVSVQNGEIVLDFAREADSFDQAVQSATTDAKKAGVSISRLEPAGAVFKRPGGLSPGQLSDAYRS